MRAFSVSRCRFVFVYRVLITGRADDRPSRRRTRVFAVLSVALVAERSADVRDNTAALLQWRAARLCGKYAACGARGATGASCVPFVLLLLLLTLSRR